MATNVQDLIQAHLATKGATKCPRHAPATGQIRYNFARAAYKEEHPELFRD